MASIGFKLAAVAAACFPLLAPVAEAAGWTRWRGPNQDGTSTGNRIFTDEAFGLDVAWSRPLGLAYSGIAVADGRAVTMFADGEFDWLTAVGARTGEEFWRYKIDAMFPKNGGSEGGAVSTPVIDGDVVYGLGAKGHLFAVRLEDGREIWSLRIDEQLEARRPNWGFATTPLVVGGVLFVQTGGEEGRSLTGFDKRTGKVLWSTGDDVVGYQSPILATLAGREQILAVTNKSVYGIVPETGAVLWSHEHGTAVGDDGFSTPVLLGEDRLLLTGQLGSKAFRIEKAEDGFEVEVLWTSKDIERSLATPVYYGGHIYGFDGDFLTCVDPATGEKVWKSRPPGGRGLILVDGHLVIFANDGQVVVVEASPDGYEERARTPVSDSGGYTYPSFADGFILVRNTRDIAGVTVGAAPPAVRDVAAGIPPRNNFERFVRKVRQIANKRLLVDDFMVSQLRFPVIENGKWVHFVYRGDAEDVAVTGSMTEFQVEEPLERIEGTDLYYRSYPIEPGSRWEYRFNVDFDNLQPDPLNPRRVPGDEGDLSEVVTPPWEQPAFIKPYEGQKPGRLESFKLVSEALGNEREIEVYLPPGYDQGNERYPLLVVNDGKPWLDKAQLPNSLNHLIGRRVAPVIVAFVEQPRPTMRDEFGGAKSGDYVRMLADELVPMLDERYRTLTDPEARGVMGVVTGALMAAYAAVERPDVFGKAGGCSAFLGYPFVEEFLREMESAGAKEKPSFWIVWAHHDLSREDWGVDLARDSRRLAEALDASGYPVQAWEAMDSAGWGGWRIRAAEVLQGFFPL